MGARRKEEEKRPMTGTASRREKKKKNTQLWADESATEKEGWPHTRLYILTHSIIGEISGHKNNALHLA